MIAWMDDFNKWNANANDDLFTLNLPARQVWIPKILITNANKRTFFKISTKSD
jgi:hypothetical protein